MCLFAIYSVTIRVKSILTRTYWLTVSYYGASGLVGTSQPARTNFAQPISAPNTSARDCSGCVEIRCATSEYQGRPSRRNHYCALGRRCHKSCGTPKPKAGPRFNLPDASGSRFQPVPWFSSGSAPRRLPTRLLVRHAACRPARGRTPHGSIKNYVCCPATGS